MPWADFDRDVTEWVTRTTELHGDRPVYAQEPFEIPLTVRDECGVHYHLDGELLSPVVEVCKCGAPGFPPVQIKYEQHEGGTWAGVSVGVHPM